MRIRRYLSALILGTSVIQLLMSQAPWAAQSYTIQELRVKDAIRAAGPNRTGEVAVRSGFVDATSYRITPGGSPDRDEVLDIDDIKANALNESDEVVGSATDRMAEDAVGSAVGGRVNRRGIFAVDDYINANGINDSGDVVGSANTSFGSRPCRPDIPGLVIDNDPEIEKPILAPPSGNCPISTVRAVLWTKKTGIRDLGTLPGGIASEAFGINNLGDIVGYSSGPDGVRAVLWTPGSKMQPLAPLAGGTFSKAFGINDSGLIVGSSGSPVGTRASLWKRGRIQTLGALPGETFSEAYAINSSGSIVGNSRGPAGMRGFLWESKKGMQALLALPGGRFSSVSGINDSGEIVGTAEVASGGIRAVLWSNGGEAQDLNILVSLPPNVVLTEAAGINASRQIVVLGKDPNKIHTNHEGLSRVFLLTPGGP